MKKDTIQGIYIKRWFTEKELSEVFVPAYHYLATDNRGRKLYAWLIASKDLHLLTGYEVATPSEIKIIQKNITNYEQ